MQHTIKLVIVDDHKMVRETWKMILQKDHRIEVVADCNSGADAIACAQRLQPDIILMDVNMSPMNGLEATSCIIQENPNMKIIGVSINNEPSYVKNMMQCGAKGYVTKNTNRDEMLTAIMEVFKGNTYVCTEIRDKMLKHQSQ